jgi:isoleucyl-tRNA synthetase
LQTGDGEQSVMLQTWQPLPAPAGEGELLEKWRKIRSYRGEVMRALEELRIAGKDRLVAAGRGESALRRREVRTARFARRRPALCPHLLADERSIRDASDAACSVRPLPHAKCERCWHVRADVGANPEHPGLCGRCIDNLHGEGETRAFA